MVTGLSRGASLQSMAQRYGVSSPTPNGQQFLETLGFFGAPSSSGALGLPRIRTKPKAKGNVLSSQPKLARVGQKSIQVERPPQNFSQAIADLKPEATFEFDGHKVGMLTAVMLILLERANTISSLSQQRVEMMQQQLNEMSAIKKVMGEMTNLKEKAKKGTSLMPASMASWLLKNKVNMSTDNQGRGSVQITDFNFGPKDRRKDVLKKFERLVNKQEYFRGNQPNIWYKKSKISDTFQVSSASNIDLKPYRTSDDGDKYVFQVSYKDLDKAFYNVKYADHIYANKILAKFAEEYGRDPDAKEVAISEGVKFNKDQWGTNIQYMQTKIDSMTQDQQLAYIKLKSYVDKANDAYEGASSTLSKISQTTSFIFQHF